MPALLSSSLTGRRRFIVLAFFIVIVVFYSVHQTDQAPWSGDAGGEQTGLGRVDPNSGAAGARKGGSGSGTTDNYREHEYDPLHPTQDATIPPEQTSAPNRWIDKPVQSTPGGSSTITDDANPEEPCREFMAYMRARPGPPSAGKRQFPYMRPPPHCRTFNLPDMEDLIATMKSRIQDPDLFRLFENSYPNTLDTMIKWRGYAADREDMELTYVITGDIDAMWLRDSASQIYSYLPLLKPSDSSNSLASLWRGLINSHSRYIIISPYCHSFQPPPESGIPPTPNGANSVNRPNPGFDAKKVFDCKWELDSLGSFLQVSSAYYDRTGDVEFFNKFVWVDAVEAAVDAAGAMRLGTYAPDGKVEHSAYTFTGQTNRGSETLTNDGLGNPVKENGMVRSSFRPSDDACIFQHLTPSNMLWAKYLEEASHIMAKLDNPKAENLTRHMRSQALGIRRGIAKDAVVEHKEFGRIFAYEVDGYGSANMMDDSNIPSLLSMPLFNYSQTSIPGHESLRDTSSGSSDSSSFGSDTSTNAETPGGAAAGLESESQPKPESEPEEPTEPETELEAPELLEPELEPELDPGREPEGKPEMQPELEAEAEAELERQAELDKEKRNADSTPIPVIASRRSSEEGGVPDHDYAAVYQASRKFILSSANPYYMWGPVISAVGGPHLGPGKAWPMAAVVAAMTAYDPISGIETPEDVVAEQLKMLLDSTNNAGLIHESVSTHTESVWTRPWFGWANGLFGELVMKISENEKEGEGLLAKSWQE